MAFLFGTDYVSSYGHLPLIAQPPGSLCFPALAKAALHLPQTVVLTLKGRLWTTSDSSDIRYLNGPAYARVRGRRFSLTDKHTLECLDGTPLLNVKQSMFTRPPEYQVYQGDTSSCLAAEIKVLNWGRPNLKLGVFLPGHPTPVIVVKGSDYQASYFGFIGDPKAGGQKVLSIIREGRDWSNLLSPLSYNISIAANMDIGIALALAMVLDDMAKQRAEQRRRNRNR